MFSFHASGSFDKTEAFLKSMMNFDITYILDHYGRIGAASLASATPVDSGLASTSWGYFIERTKSGWSITWTNTDIENGFPVAIMLQYGYGTGTGGYVEGQDYINPAIQPIFDMIANEVWKAVTSA